MSEPWFVLLRIEIERTTQTAVAQRLGLSRGAVSQVFRGTGEYGAGRADTSKFAARVLQMLGQVQCPFLTRAKGEAHWISGDACRGYAYRECPTNSSMATRHWQSCRSCDTRVSAPRGWSEAEKKVIPIRAAARGSGGGTTGVAAPAHQPTTEKEAA